MFRGMMQRVDRLLGRGVIDEALYEDLEEALLQADTPISVTGEILEELRQAVRTERITDPAGIKGRLQEAIRRRFDQKAKSALYRHIVNPTVYLFVGVNGVGKTTTIGKLATRLVGQGRKVLLAPGDTFRAAAIDQLKLWSERSGAEFINAQPGADPGSVIFDAVTAAKARNIEFVLADTAGRQHTKAALMHELGKITKVLEKAHGRPADEVLLVLDANTGQNAIRQAEEFRAAAQVTGLVLTKLDGTSRGGALIGIHERLGIPVKLIGLGERPDQLQDFDPDVFAAQLFE